jgi:hypothetical protein
MKRHLVRPAAAVALTVCSIAILFSTCTPSLQLANVWRDPSYNLGPMKSMMVISVNKDRIKRRMWEDAFAVELSKHRVAVTSSYHEFPDAFPDTNQITDAVRRYGYDGVLIISALPIQTQSTPVAPYATTEPVTQYNPWRNRYYTRYVEEVHPGYVETSKIVSHEVDVWSTKGHEQMVWSGTCAIADPVSTQQIHDETIGLIVHDLTKAAIILKR